MARDGNKSSNSARGRGRPALGPASSRRASAARLRQVLGRFALADYLSYRDFLKRLYELMKADHPSYSYFQLAEDLGFSRTNVMWLVISGRRRLTRRATDRMAVALQLSAFDRRYLEALQRYGNARRPNEREKLLQELLVLKGQRLTSEAGKKTLEFYSEWYHPVLRELVGLPDFAADPQWINARLIMKLTPLEIKRSLDLLERLGLITYDAKKGRMVQTGGQILPDRDVERLASMRFHQQMCDMAREAVTRVPAERRELNTLTLSISDETAMRAGEILYKACEQIMMLETETKQRGQVFQVNVHLFPFTKQPGA